ncbi:hypothetical protein ACTMTF_45795 [Nonomuraea sp. ZG12]|uniref:hypothetical protein n=1 Tax=Nonomuraea sp. ZG12 TaxID=3452207 RepID=UPI003F8B51DF
MSPVSLAPPRAVLEGSGEPAGHLLVQNLGGQAEVGIGGDFGVGGAFLLGFGGGAIERVVGVGVDVFQVSAGTVDVLDLGVVAGAMQVVLIAESVLGPVLGS